MLYANLKTVEKKFNSEDFYFRKKQMLINKSVTGFVDFRRKFYIRNSMSSDEELHKLQTYYICLNN